MGAKLLTSSSATEAREALRHMLQLGFHPGHESSTDRSVFVYVYKIEAGTTE